MASGARKLCYPVEQASRANVGRSRDICNALAKPIYNDSCKLLALTPLTPASAHDASSKRPNVECETEDSGLAMRHAEGPRCWLIRCSQSTRLTSSTKRGGWLVPILRKASLDRVLDLFIFFYHTNIAAKDCDLRYRRAPIRASKLPV